ncbi:condensation domain-containing protein, partial [Legionella oakridgensis]|uniref:condensation domain-containing protein n=1 Tax=Legionella oakridgensis TaxID=29423 RepID=UPI00055B2744
MGLYEEHVLFVIHHIAFDGWSMELLRQELEGDILPLEVQYKDFAAWQRVEVESRWDALRQYWVEKLSGTEVLHLPTDYPRSSRIDYRGASIGFDLPYELQSFSKRHHVTPFAMCLTMFGVLLSRYTGQKDIVIGTPVVDRQHPQLAPLIGFFINNLVIKITIEEKSLVELLKQVQLDLIEAQAHQEMPFEKLVDALEVERDPSRHPIFQVICSVDHVQEMILEGNSSEEHPSYEIANADLRLSVLVTPTA